MLLSPSPRKAVEPKVVEEGKEQGLGGRVGQGWWEQRWGRGEGAAAISRLHINLSHCLLKSITNGVCY